MRRIKPCAKYALENNGDCPKDFCSCRGGQCSPNTIHSHLETYTDLLTAIRNSNTKMVRCGKNTVLPKSQRILDAENASWISDESQSQGSEVQEISELKYENSSSIPPRPISLIRSLPSLSSLPSSSASRMESLRIMSGSPKSKDDDKKVNSVYMKFNFPKFELSLSEKANLDEYIRDFFTKKFL